MIQVISRNGTVNGIAFKDSIEIAIGIVIVNKTIVSYVVTV